MNPPSEFTAEMDLTAVAEKWLQPCGACDGGLPMGCSHPDEDYRPVLLALVEEVERLRHYRPVARVHNHPPYRSVCNERLVGGPSALRGACLNDDGTDRVIGPGGSGI